MTGDCFILYCLSENINDSSNFEHPSSLTSIALTYISFYPPANLTVFRIASDWERKEELGVEKDVWRSKFLASSVIVDELTRTKASSRADNQIFFSVET